ncbi:MAG: iron-containing redox enzyme family protein [Methylococcales bacterium]
MKKIKHPFDPELIQLYSNNKFEAKPINSRNLFYRLTQSNKLDIMPTAYQFIDQGLRQAEHTYSSLLLTNYTEQRLSDLKPRLIKPLTESFLTADNLCECIKQYAPVQLTQPCWLQNISQICCCQELTAVQVMDIYLQLTKQNRLQNLYLALLLAEGIKTPILHSYHFSQQTDISTGFFDFSATQLALSCFPRVFFAEILGFTLAYLQMPTLVEACFPNTQIACLFFKQQKLVLTSQLTPLRKSITAYLNLFPQHQQALWQRIQQGFCLYQLRMQKCRDQFNSQCSEFISPQQAISQLFKQKLQSAKGHHQKIKLQGKPLEQWFVELPENNESFLQALKESNYVDNENPLNSHLLKLFEFNGPMFGVFNQAERRIIENWLLDNKPVNKTACYQGEQTNSFIPLINNEQPLKKYANYTNRKLYYYLLNADLFPDVLPVAKVKVGRLLKFTSLFNPLPFKYYSHQQLDDFIQNIYQTEIANYQPLKGKPSISKQAYIWGIKQIAPMILIDGCWLQNCHRLQKSHAEIYQILFSIYADEIGNGQQQQNHCYIFQQLLNSLAIKVPPVFSKEFINSPGFINSAFDLPSYMLALSLHSELFLAELLGLNMAIELSGLGKSYQQLVDEWNYWGINTTIADLHISIDNYSSGHTFLAKKAIQLYMDDLLKRTADSNILDKHWQRIYRGYASLGFVGKRFKLELPVYYMLNKIKS